MRDGPALGLVCITRSEEVRYRTITLTRYRSLPDDAARAAALEDLYAHNLTVLESAVAYCAARGIRLYRVTANLLPVSDLPDGIGLSVFEGMAGRAARLGPFAARLGVRVVVHPEQYVVLNSERPLVASASALLLEHQARILDALGLPRSTWAAMNVHCGKRGRSGALVEAVSALSPSARSRLTFENDERSYGAEETLEVCRASGVPMVFDLHHHVVREKIGLDDPSLARFVDLAGETWTPRDWQIVHVSSGREGPHDARHHEFVTEVPAGLRLAPWIEVEAKAKEDAIASLSAMLDANAVQNVNSRD